MLLSPINNFLKLSAFATTQSILYALYSNQQSKQNNREYAKERALSADPAQSGNHYAEHEKNKVTTGHQIINRAFYDYGFKGKVLLDPNAYKNKTIATAPLDSGDALVLTSRQFLTKTDPRIIYAFAGHEAAHIKHHDALRVRFITPFLYSNVALAAYFLPCALKHAASKYIRTKMPTGFFSPILGLPLVAASFFFTKRYLIPAAHKSFEVHADVSVAAKLGVGQDMINHFNDLVAENERAGQIEGTTRHPYHQTRINYLTFLNKLPCVRNSSLLFQVADPKESKENKKSIVETADRASLSA